MPQINTTECSNQIKLYEFYDKASQLKSEGKEDVIVLVNKTTAGEMLQEWSTGLPLKDRIIHYFSGTFLQKIDIGWLQDIFRNTNYKIDSCHKNTLESFISALKNCYDNNCEEIAQDFYGKPLTARDILQVKERIAAATPTHQLAVRTVQNQKQHLERMIDGFSISLTTNVYDTLQRGLQKSGVLTYFNIFDKDIRRALTDALLDYVVNCDVSAHRKDIAEIVCRPEGSSPSPIQFNEVKSPLSDKMIILLGSENYQKIHSEFAELRSRISEKTRVCYRNEIITSIYLAAREKAAKQEMLQEQKAEIHPEDIRSLNAVLPTDQSIALCKNISALESVVAILDRMTAPPQENKARVLADINAPAKAPPPPPPPSVAPTTLNEKATGNNNALLQQIKERTSNLKPSKNAESKSESTKDDLRNVLKMRFQRLNSEENTTVDDDDDDEWA